MDAVHIIVIHDLFYTIDDQLPDSRTGGVIIELSPVGQDIAGCLLVPVPDPGSVVRREQSVIYGGG